MQAKIYHWLGLEAWEAFQASGWYAPASLATEGFIHFARLEQAAFVANTYYHEMPSLVLIEVDPRTVEADLRDEEAAPPDGSLPSHVEEQSTRFPHLYAALALDAVLRTWTLTQTEKGFVLPDLDN